MPKNHNTRSQQDVAVDYSDLLEEWRRSLRAANKAPTTMKTYTESVRNLLRYSNGQTVTHRLTRPETGASPVIDHRVIQDFLADLLERTSAGYASLHYRSLLQFFKWVALEEDIDNPMLKVSPVTVPIKPVEIVTDDMVRKLLKVCDHRDKAIILVLKSSGVRVGELVGMRYEDLDLSNQVVEVCGKGRKRRLVPFDDDAATAISRYLRRTGHPRRGPLWLGRKGPLSRSGVAQMLARRCREAGLPRIHPHQWRHTWTHNVLAAGLREGDVQSLAGWSSPQMLQRYGASLRHQRAIESYRRIGR